MIRMGGQYNKDHISVINIRIVGVGKERQHPLLELLHLEDYWPCGSGLGSEAIGTQLRDLIYSGLTRWRLTL